jgi:hypothetical protein
MEDRPSPQELLRMVEDFMARHADGMDRWGTLSWVKQKSSEIDGPILSKARNVRQLDHLIRPQTPNVSKPRLL